jgi:hypothetical protein
MNDLQIDILFDFIFCYLLYLVLLIVQLHDIHDNVKYDLDYQRNV